MTVQPDGGAVLRPYLVKSPTTIPPNVSLLSLLKFEEGMFFNTPKCWVVVPLLYLPKISRMGFLHNTIAQACSLRARAIRPVDTLFLDRKFIGHFSRTSTRREISESRSRSAVLPYHIQCMWFSISTIFTSIVLQKRPQPTKQIAIIPQPPVLGEYIKFSIRPLDPSFV